MSLCDNCKTRSERPTTHAAMTREYYKVLIAALRHVAERCGYAIAVHGSLGEDIDLVAVPWRDSCISQSGVAEELRACAEVIIGTARIRECDKEPTKKPCGRLAFSFYLGVEGTDVPYIDLSVMAKGKHDEAKID